MRHGRSKQVNETLKAIFRQLPRAEHLPRDSTVFVTFTNGHYSDLMLNSVATLAALGLSVFVYCFDVQAVQLCQDLGIPYFTPPPDRFMEAADFRQDRAKFLEMGVHKPEIVLRLFEGVRATGSCHQGSKQPCALTDSHDCRVPCDAGCADRHGYSVAEGPPGVS